MQKILILVFSLVFYCASAVAETALPLRIGFVLPITGDWAFLGAGIRDSALLAKEDLKKQGTPVELFFEDNHGELAASSLAGKKLLEVQKVDAMISLISGVSKLLQPMATKHEAINIGICSDESVADGKFSFINYLTAEQGVKKFAEYFPKSFGSGKSLGVFSLNEAGFLNIVDQLKQQNSKDFKVAFVETFDKGLSDFRSLLLRSMKQKPDVFLILGLSPEIETLVTQARSIGITVPVTSIEGFGLAANKAPFENSWFVDSATPNDEYIARFTKTYGYDVTPGVGHSYDTVMLLSQAFQAAAARSGSRKELVDEFKKISNYTGVIGSITIGANGIIGSEASIKFIRNGKGVAK